MVSTVAALPNVTVPGPLTFVQVVVTAPGGFGRPSSVTVPSSVAVAGKVIVWSGPALTTGGVFAGAPGAGAVNSYSLPSTSFGSVLLSRPRSTM